MTPKKKANEIIQKMAISTSYGTNYTGGDDIPIYKNLYAIECAKLLVEEILSEHMWDDSEYGSRRFKYWEQVKEELGNF